MRVSETSEPCYSNISLYQFVPFTLLETLCETLIDQMSGIESMTFFHRKRQNNAFTSYYSTLLSNKFVGFEPSLVVRISKILGHNIDHRST